MNASLFKTNPLCLVARRSMSLNEISAILRPFIFEVHPDRFAHDPKIREQNEKSLQVFNGYLNDLFPVSASVRPIKVNFSIFSSKSKDLKNIQINLSGTDPIRIAKHALESCNLSTESVSKVKPTANVNNIRTSFSSSDFEQADIDQDLLKMYLKKKNATDRTNDLSAVLMKSKTDAIKKTHEAKVTQITLRDEIADVKYRTGAKDIIWQINWSETHMRRCLGNVHRLLDQSDVHIQELLRNALHKNVLRFGRGSFVCCDGSIQFGADNVPEQWEQVCSEYPLRKSQIPKLAELVSVLRDYVGGALVILHHQKGLSQAVQQVQSLLTRIQVREELQTKLRELASDTMIEVVTSYDELAIGMDGRLYIPCNVDIPSLVIFLEESAEASRQINKDMMKLKVEVEMDRDDCVSTLSLTSLTWESCCHLDQVLTSIRRLINCDANTRNLVSGLSIHLSVNPNVHVMPDGRVSVPLNWV